MGRSKLTLPLGDSTVIETVLGVIEDSAIDEVVVVTGHHADEVESVLAGKVPTTRNVDPDRGNLSSLRCGIEALGEGFDGVVVVLGDMPGVKSTVIDLLVDGFSPGVDAVVPVYTDGIGHPVVVSLELIATVDGTVRQPLWSAISTLAPPHMLEVPINTPKPIDINTIEDHREANTH